MKKTKFTQKHYELIAELIRKEKVDILNRRKEILYLDEAIAVIMDLEDSFCGMFAEDSIRFKKEVFKKMCAI